MERSSRFSLVIVTSTALMLGGCAASRNAQGQCVDASGRVMPDSYCRTGSSGRYIYGGSVSNGRVIGGSTTPPASSVSRGGFGSFGSFGG